MCLFSHLRDQSFFATEMLVILSKSGCVLTLAHRVSRELDNGDDHDQANNDTEDGSDDSRFVPGFARIEVSKLLAS